MPHKRLIKFFFSIVLPSLLAIFLFIASFFLVIIPQFEKNLMNAKKETIRELTQSAWSVINEYYSSYREDTMGLQEAKRLAAHQVRKMRYGKEHKDYFWIIDQQPNMVMHPYRPNLEGKDLSDYQDSHGKKLFVKAAEVVNKEGDGFINYYWQWKDDTSRIVPKLSYVKAFEPFNWIIGTGIYLEDVRAEIAHLKNRLFYISAGIILFIILAWVYVIRQSFRLENKRRAAEQNLRLSRQKYKSLVEASNDGTLMLVNDRIIYHNQKFNKLTGRAPEDSEPILFDALFNVRWNDIKSDLEQPGKSRSVETQLIIDRKHVKDVVLSISRVDYAGEEGFIVIVKDVSADKQVSRESHELHRELQVPLLLMNQPISGNIKSHLSLPLTANASEAAKMMKRNNQEVVFITSGEQIIGVVSEDDLKNRLLAEDKDAGTPLSTLMTAPVVWVADTTLLYEAIIKLWKNEVSHLLVKNAQEVAIGVISKSDLHDLQKNSMSYLVEEIHTTETIEELASLHKRVPLLVNALLESGSKPANITHIISSVADHMTQRVIELTLSALGQPPTDFCFMSMGSEGRQEETLYTDQDNAIVFNDTKEEETVSKYFRELGRRVNVGLDMVGYKFCPGDVMAGNPKWCQSLSAWKKYFTEWTHAPDPENVTDSSIFFDFRCVYGNEKLSMELRHHLNNETERNGLFFYHMAHSLVRFKPSLHSETTDLKKLIFPLVSGIRIYALHHKLSIANTIERLKQLEIEKNENLKYEELVYIYDFLMHLRLKVQTHSIMNHEPPDNLLDLNDLNPIQNNIMRNTVSEINEFITGLTLTFTK